MNILDMGIILLGVVVLVRSYFRGLVQEVASLGGLVLAVVVSLRYYSQAERFLQAAFGPAPYLAAVGFGLLFLATLVLVALISGRLTKLMAKGPLGGLDRLLGFCFGTLKAAFLAVLCVFVLTFLVGPSKPIVANSRLAPLALEAADWSLERLPKNLSKSLAEARAKIDEELSAKDEFSSKPKKK
ncbi:MAG: CvpA family protein [Deltaproteobacteria bacterium]|nr:CvpA family protein [Deltaproteobacteria bacterium]